MTSTQPINDGVDGWMVLCHGGITLSGVHCTGEAMVNGQYIRCSDPVHPEVLHP